MAALDARQVTPVCRGAAGLEKLRAFGNVTALDAMTPEELKDQIKNYDALIIRSASKVLLSRL